MISSNMMTALGVFGIMFSYMLTILPEDTPFWVKLTIGTVNAGLSFLLGKTNQGTVVPPTENKQVVIITGDKEEVKKGG